MRALRKFMKHHQAVNEQHLRTNFNEFISILCSFIGTILIMFLNFSIIFHPKIGLQKKDI